MCEFKLYKDGQHKGVFTYDKGLMSINKAQDEKMQILKISRFESSIKILFEPLCLGYKYFISL